MSIAYEKTRKTKVQPQPLKQDPPLLGSYPNTDTTSDNPMTSTRSHPARS